MLTLAQIGSEAKDGPHVVKSYPSGAKVVTATMEHAVRLAPMIRKLDKFECMAMGSTPIEALTYGLHMDDVTLTVLNKEGNPIAMFGVGHPKRDTNEHPRGYIWLLGSEDIKRYGYEFMRDSKKFAKMLIQPYSVLENYVYAHYDEAVKWLMFLGADIVTKKDISGLPFYKFRFKNPNLN
jgi:hypothetical protein